MTRTELEAERHALSLIQRMRDLLANALISSTVPTKRGTACADHNIQASPAVGAQRAKALPSE